METEAVFSIESETIDINGMDAMVQFSRYNPFAKEDFATGLVLSDDLTNRFGTVLLSRGTELTPRHMERLIELKASNPSLDFLFKISRSAMLINRFRNEIKNDFMSLFQRQKRSNIFNDFLGSIDNRVDDFVDTVLSEENMTLLLYQMRFLCSSSKKSRRNLFMEHPLNMAMISLAIASSETYEPLVKRSRVKLLDTCKAALLHNHGALSRIDTVIDAPDESRVTVYWSACSEDISSMSAANLGNDVPESLSLLYEYQTGKRDFLNNSDWPSVLANVLVVSDLFLRNENGLFGEEVAPRKIVDRMNVLVTEHDLAELPVKALTLGLNLMDIFDFYRELGRLVKACPCNSATPYPLTGFMSPTLFLCRKSIRQCKFLDGSMSAVKIVRKFGELMPGDYHRCWLLTPKLIAFYKKHYYAIKGVVANKEGSVK